jgi:hypothetical protein
MSLEQKFITGISAGLMKNKKPFLFPDQAWQTLENAFQWRESVKKRGGIYLLGRLQRNLTSVSETATSAAATYQCNDLLSSVRATEPNAELKPGTIVFTIDKGGPNESVYEDTAGNGVLVKTSGLYNITSGSIIYTTGQLNLNFTGAITGGLATEADLSYYPALPVMGIWQRDQAAINNEQTVFFDEKYAYINTGVGFEEFIPGTTWSSTNSGLFLVF